jgi:hypothetical protein
VTLPPQLGRTLFGGILVVGGIVCAILFSIQVIVEGSVPPTPVELVSFFVIATAVIAGVGVSIIRNPNQPGVPLQRRFLVVMGSVSLAITLPLIMVDRWGVISQIALLLKLVRLLSSARPA